MSNTNSNTSSAFAGTVETEDAGFIATRRLFIEERDSLSKTGAENLNIVRKWALSLLKTLDMGKTYSLKMKRSILCSDFEQFIVTGAVQPKTSQANLKSIKIILPYIDALSQYNDIIEPLFRAKQNNDEQSRALAAIRDALLPKLMSGEIELDEAI